jgi:selenocysteine lyase/cysteine desulfurase
MAGVGGAARFLNEEPWSTVTASEAALLARLEDGLRAVPGVTLYGPENAEGRAPTTVFNVGERAPLAVAEELARRRIAVWSGDNYACELIDALGLRDRGGVVRAGIVRHTNAADVDALIAAIGEIAADS